VFGSDSTYADESRLGALLIGEIEEPALEIDEVVVEAEADEPDDDDPDDVDDDEEVALPAVPPDAEPVGDADLLSDLGVPGHHLLELCAQDGMMPADITAEVCLIMGCADEIEELREV